MSTVFDLFKSMVRTGFTGVDLIMGNKLQEVMEIVVAELIRDSEIFGLKSIDFNSDYDRYTGQFYHHTWTVTVRPIVAQYVERNTPNAWYKNYYTLNLKPN